jgi:hypothetical protein
MTGSKQPKFPAPPLNMSEQDGDKLIYEDFDKPQLLASSI